MIAPQESLHNAHQILPIKEWTSDANRTAFEQEHGTALGAYAYEFNAAQGPQYQVVKGMLIGAAYTIAEGQEMRGVRVVDVDQYDNPDGTFSGGLLFLGAPNMQVKTQHQECYCA
jgi:hypothetical protein